MVEFVATSSGDFRNISQSLLRTRGSIYAASMDRRASRPYAVANRPRAAPIFFAVAQFH
jgi:hypothetical protein